MRIVVVEDGGSLVLWKVLAAVRLVLREASQGGREGANVMPSPPIAAGGWLAVMFFGVTFGTTCTSAVHPQLHAAEAAAGPGVVLDQTQVLQALRELLH